MSQISINNIYQLKTKEAEGNFSEVYLTTKAGSNRIFITKKMDRITNSIESSQNRCNYIQNEITILRQLDHPNIVKFENYWHDDKFHYLVMEYINGGNLSNCLKKYKKKYGKQAFTEEIVQYLMKQIVSAIKYIHSKNIIHRDIKLDNIMVNFDNTNDCQNLNMMKAKIKIIDFGFAVELKHGHLAYSAFGTGPNMDPLLLKKFLNKKSKELLNIGYEKEVDIWSLGTICYQMIIGAEVFDWDSLGNLLENVEKGFYNVPTNLSMEIVSFLNGMLQYYKENRLNIEQLENHPFLKKNVKNFKMIDLRRLQNKIRNNNININIKNNKTIWSIFNQDTEKTLVSISGLYRNDLNDKPIQESYGFKNKASGPILSNSTYSTLPFQNHFKDEQQYRKTNTFNNERHISINNNNNNYPGNGGKSFYGQDMHPNNNTNINMGNQFGGLPQYFINDKNINNRFNIPRINSLPINYNHNNNNLLLSHNNGNKSYISKSQVYNQNQNMNYYEPINNDDTKKRLCIIF